MDEATGTFPHLFEDRQIKLVDASSTVLSLFLVGASSTVLSVILASSTVRTVLLVVAIALLLACVGTAGVPILGSLLSSVNRTGDSKLTDSSPTTIEKGLRGELLSPESSIDDSDDLEDSDSDSAYVSTLARAHAALEFFYLLAFLA
jgi:hypothetical protein